MEKHIVMTNREIQDSVNILLAMIANVDQGDIIVSDPKFSYVMGRNLRILQSENVDYSNGKNDLLREYGEYFLEGKNEGYRINQQNVANYKAYNEKIRALSDIKHDIVVYAVPMETIDSWNLPFSMKAALWFIAEDGE